MNFGLERGFVGTQKNDHGFRRAPLYLGLLASTALSLSLFCAAPALAQSANPDDYRTPQYNNQWGLDMIGAAAAYARGYTGAGIVVGVGDSGIDPTHPAFDLGGGLSKIDPRSRSFLLPSPSDYADRHRHGTHVAGTIVAKKDDGDTIGMHGVAYNANVLMMRFLTGDRIPGSHPDLDILHYLASPGLADVRIFNASYGPDYTRMPPQHQWNASYWGYEAEAVWHVLKQGKIIVAANGNDFDRHPAARNPDGIALYPFIRPEHAHLGVYNDDGQALDFSEELLTQPGKIIAVMSVGEDKRAAYYSNHCGVAASWCVAAPGGDMSAGRGIYATVPVALAADPTQPYQELHGTSMAAPHVSGALAVLMQAYPHYNADDLTEVLFSTAEFLGDPRIYGYGLIRLDHATAGPTALAGGADVGVAGGHSTYWSQPLLASGSFSKSGDGKLIIAGQTTALEDVHVMEGTLGVDGTLVMGTPGAPRTLTVAQSGTLVGMGTIHGNVFVNGTLSPGHPIGASNVAVPSTVVGSTFIGQLDVEGNLSLGGTATTVLKLDGPLLVPGGPGTVDRILVSGTGSTFTAGGTLMPVLRGLVGTNFYTPSLGTQHVFLSAQEGARALGSFAGLTQPADGLPHNTRFDVLYSPSALSLVVTPKTFAGPGGPALTPNQRAVAEVLDSVRPAAGVRPGGSAKPVFDALYGLSGKDAYLGAFSDLSGQGQAATAGAIFGAYTALTHTIATRQRLLQSGSGDAQAALMPSVAFSFAPGAQSAVAQTAAPAFAGIDAAPAGSQSAWSVWGQGFGSWASTGQAGSVPGATSSSSGFTFGADRMLASDLTVGMAFGYARTHTDSAGTEGRSDTYAGAAYGTWTPGPWVLDTRVAAGPSTISTTRRVGFVALDANGSTQGLGALAAGELGYRLAAGPLTVKPFAGMTWQGFRRGAFTETSAFGLSYPERSFTKIALSMGLSLSTSFQSSQGITFMPELRLSWEHDLRNDALTTRAALLGTAFPLVAADPGADGARIGLTLTGWQQSNFRVFASYEGEVRRNAVGHEVAGGLRFAW